MATRGSHLLFKLASIYEFRFDWERTSVNVENNASVISWTVSIDSTSPNHGLGTVNSCSINSLKVNVDGTTYSFGTVRPILQPRGTVQIAKGTSVIPHNSSGVQAFTAFISWDSFGYYFNGNGWGTTTADVSGNQIWATLDYIVRSASITSVSSTSITDEDALTIEYTNPAQEYTIQLQMGMSLTTTDTDMFAEYRDISKTGTSYTFNLSAEELALLYKVLDTRVSSTRVRVFLKSVVPVLDGEDSQTVIDYRDITVHFVNYKPTMNVTLKDTSLRSLEVTGNEKTFIRGVSDAQFNLNAQVYKGATYEHHYIQNGDNLIDQTSGYLTEVTSNTFYAYVEDSRDYYIAEEIVLGKGRWSEYKWIDYFPVTCKINSAVLDANGNCEITISGKVFQGDFGLVSNYLRMEYALTDDTTGSTTYSEVQVIQPNIDDASNYTYSFTIPNMRYTGGYSLDVLIIDAVMTVNAPTASIISAIPVYDYSGEDFAFHVPVSIDGNLTTSGTIKTNGNIVPSIVQQGVDYNGWTYRKWSDGLLECWITKPILSTISNQSVANWYSSGELAASILSFPFEFVERPTVTVTLTPTGNTWALLTPSNTTVTNTATGSYQLLATYTHTTQRTYLLNYDVKGRWK